MTKQEFIKYYWNNYLLLEKKFIDTSDYVAIDRDNSAAFSHEYLNLFILICNDFDAVATEFCKCLGYETSNKYQNILVKIANIKGKCSSLNILKAETFFDNNNIFAPFAKFSEESASDWWQDYNSVKHNRVGIDEITKHPNYHKANQKNVITALSGLYILLVTLYDFLKTDEEHPGFNYKLESKVFKEIKK